jgi:hypothetical protein
MHPKVRLEREYTRALWWRLFDVVDEIPKEDKSQ